MWPPHRLGWALYGRGLGVAVSMAVSGLAPAENDAARCAPACQQAITVLQNPRDYELLVRHTHTDAGHSAVYLTWTAKQAPVLAPLQFAGELPATLQQPLLQRVWLPDPANGCVATLELVDLGAPERTTHQVPARNVGCETPALALGRS